jgi:hypothetical protein
MTGRRARRVVTRAEVRHQVDATLEALLRRYPGRIDHLRIHAIHEIQSWPDLELEVVDTAHGGELGGCELAGSYRTAAGRPLITVVDVLSRPRQQFTALHELGHHLQHTERDLARVLAREPSDDRQLEERACDGFAAAVLLPDESLAAHIGNRGPTASDLVALHRACPSASRAACCVAALNHLPSPGHVLLLDPAGTLLFAASNGYPKPATGSDQSSSRLIAKALHGFRSARVEETRLLYSDGGWAGEALFGDAAWYGNYLFAVLTVDQVPWQQLSVRAPTSPPLLDRHGWWHCEGCEALFPRATATNCHRCGESSCPECSWCSCKKRSTTKVCQRCFTTLSVREQTKGLVEHEECP